MLGKNESWMEGVARILIVDDDPNVHETLKPWLEREGYIVQSAYSGSEALDFAGRNVPSVVVLDAMLPGLDGVSVCLELNRKLPTVPVLMLSARDDLMDRVVGLESGADDYVTKPFHPREIVTRVKALLRRIRSSPHRSGPDTGRRTARRTFASRRRQRSSKLHPPARFREDCQGILALRGVSMITPRRRAGH